MRALEVSWRAAILAGILLLLAFAPAHAYTCSGSNCTPSVSYTEPTTYVGGTPLTNLQDGQFTYQLNGGPNQVLTIPASAPSGGGVKSNIPLAAQSVPACTTGTVTGSLVMRTTAGGVSAAVTAVPLVIDRTKLVSGLPDPACTTPNQATPTLQ